VLQRRGQLQEQLQTQLAGQVALQQLTTAVAELEQTLQTGDYAVDEREELRLLDQRLQSLHYDEKDHALARGEVDRWRWAEIRQAELRQALKRQVYLHQQLPKLEADLTTLNQQKDQILQATAYHLEQYDRQLVATGYDLERHTALRAGLRQAHNWQVQYQELCRAKQHYPAVQQQVETLKQRLHNQQQTLQAITLEHEQLSRYLAETPDLQQEIAALEQHLHQQHAQRDDYLAYLGRLQQQHQQLEALTQQQQTLEHQVQTAQRQYRVYQEVAQAFGKNGIQALMIETVLPQLEAETNQILSRLSANQLHVQFVTQRLGRKSSLSRTPGKPIETLDILIADTRGTRPYETYSGGEAFRVNFAIRLALAKLLAQRSGTALQLLIVDEGFGTQDAEGCDRLIAAINAIAPEFACILAVTHVPHFKEAFQSRIEVIKTDEGSQLQLLA
ncbi:MAG: SbcC/MukB-like Walker B domain-containing protein, partial [Leptolyngbyaceae cyanobacterium]